MAPFDDGSMLWIAPAVHERRGVRVSWIQISPYAVVPDHAGADPDTGGRVASAIDAWRLDLAYQPIVDKSGAVVLFEALWRLRDDKGNTISPDVFIDTIASLDMQGDMDLLVVTRAAEALKNMSSSTPISINLSPSSILDTAWWERLKCEKPDAYTALCSGRIVIEILESEEYTPHELNASLRPLVDEGIRFALDDFLSGYHTVEHVTQLDLSLFYIIKFSGEEILNHTRQTYPNETERLQRLDTIFHHMQTLIREIRERNPSALIVCEKIENAEIADKARRAGFDLLQGFLYGRPSSELRSHSIH